MEKKFNSLQEWFAGSSDESMAERSAAFLEIMKKRRTIRFFSRQPVPRRIIENCVRAAATAPSGANCQPWHFVAVSDPVVKRTLRQRCEAVEKEFYEKHAPREWLDALAPLGTNSSKPFLEEAPWLIVVFVKRFDVGPEGESLKQYYNNESIGIATGMLITALHNAGLGTLTYTPSPMGFLNEVLHRPENERGYMVIVAGLPAKECPLPDLERKGIERVSTFI